MEQILQIPRAKTLGLQNHWKFRVMLILLGLIYSGLEKGIFVNHKISAVVKNNFFKNVGPQ